MDFSPTDTGVPASSGVGTSRMGISLPPLPGAGALCSLVITLLTPVPCLSTVACPCADAWDPLSASSAPAAGDASLFAGMQTTAGAAPATATALQQPPQVRPTLNITPDMMAPPQVAPMGNVPMPSPGLMSGISPYASMGMHQIGGQASPMVGMTPTGGAMPMAFSPMAGMQPGQAFPPTPGGQASPMATGAASPWGQMPSMTGPSMKSSGTNDPFAGMH